jgi:hypothetical protein
MSNMCVLSTKRDFIEMVAENKTERERERERDAKDMVIYI